MLGTLKIKVNARQYFVVTGGPFADCPADMHGVKMAKEIRQSCAIDIPTVDFRTPSIDTLSAGLDRAVGLVLAGEPLYVGCMAGRGRTGLFLAVLAKAFGEADPVAYVRKHYYAHAVETADQHRFVMNFPIPEEVLTEIAAYRRWAWLRFWKTNLTRLPKPVASKIPLVYRGAAGE